MIVPPADPVDALPALGQTSTVVTTAPPAKMTSAEQASAAPVAQAAPEVPVAGGIETGSMQADAADTAPETIDISTYGVPAVAAATPAVAAPESAAGVEAETQTAVIATPVTSGNTGFGTQADAGDSGGSAGLAATDGGAPAVAAPAQLGNTVIAESLPADTASALKPEGGFTLSGQTIIPVDETTGADLVSPDASRGAFLDYAQDFDAATDKPAIAIVLLADTVDQATQAMALTSPVSIAVRADNPDAANIVNTVRSLGGEALMFLPEEGAKSIPGGTDPASAVETLTESLAAIPGVIGIVDGPDGDLPSDTKLLSAVLAALDDQGFGIVTTTSIGLNRAEIMANESAIPAASILRRIDTEPGKIPVIRQMDKAVLQIGDGGKTVVFGAASNDVLSALKFWMKSNKAQNVTVAPVSFTMK